MDEGADCRERADRGCRYQPGGGPKRLSRAEVKAKLARLEDTVTNWLHNYAAGELGKGGSQDDELPPIRLTYPLQYVLHAWAANVRFGIYPRPGGYDAQDPTLIADFSLLTRHYNRIVRDMTDKGEGAQRDDDSLRNLDVDKFIGAIAGVERRNWQDIMGE